jgi:hypothetical protein
MSNMPNVNLGFLQVCRILRDRVLDHLSSSFCLVILHGLLLYTGGCFLVSTTLVFIFLIIGWWESTKNEGSVKEEVQES